MRFFFLSYVHEKVSLSLDMTVRFAVKMSGIFIRNTEIHACFREKKTTDASELCKQINNSEGKVWHHLERSYCYEKRKLNMLILH